MGYRRYSPTARGTPLANIRIYVVEMVVVVAAEVVLHALPSVHQEVVVRVVVARAVIVIHILRRQYTAEAGSGGSQCGKARGRGERVTPRASCGE